MERSALLTVSIMLAAGVADKAYADGEALWLSADTPSIEVEPRSDRRRPVRLPDLDYNFSVHASCGEGRSVRAIIVSIADTRHEATGEQLEVLAELPRQ